MKIRWSIILAAGIALFGALALILTREEAGTQETQPSAPAVSGTSGQPIAFPHNKHAGDFQIDCQYCHFAVERSQSAGIPPVATCIGCHAPGYGVNGTENPQEVELLRGYAQRGEAIPWNRIYKVADHVQFPHMRHISAGVECVNCHGNVAEIGVIQEVNQKLTMGFCVNCHIENGASRDCTVCHY
jgi:hypothetical protein